MAEIFGLKGEVMSHVASGDLSAAQFRFVNGGGVDVYLTVTTGSPSYGVLQNKPRNDEHASVIRDGATKIGLGSSFGANTWLMNGANGWATIALSGQVTMGLLITGATSGGVGQMQLNQAHIYGGNP